MTPTRWPRHATAPENAAAAARQPVGSTTIFHALGEEPHGVDERRIRHRRDLRHETPDDRECEGAEMLGLGAVGDRLGNRDVDDLA